jgi:hypothetical protein
MRKIFALDYGTVIINLARCLAEHSAEHERQFIFDIPMCPATSKSTTEDGGVSNCASLAVEVGIGERYVSRVLPFAFLAPDIVEAILDGTHPPNLTFAKMAKEIPLSWAEQRDRFGFPPVHHQSSFVSH